jgi:1-acyl-sn-glycerol-3-phosphate acyltransferase
MRPRSRFKRVWFFTQLMRWGILSLIARLQIFVRASVTDRGNVPRHGAVLVCPNHQSLLDPPLVFGALRRNAAFLAAGGLFRQRGFGDLMRWMGHIPVQRGTSAAREAIDAGEAVLKGGGVVVLFPEGKCSLDGILLPAKLGMAEMAFRTYTPVVPVGLVGINRVLPLGSRWPRLGRRVEINFGTPMYPPFQSAAPTREALQAFTEQVWGQVAVLSHQPAPPAEIVAEAV